MKHFQRTITAAGIFAASLAVTPANGFERMIGQSDPAGTVSACKSGTAPNEVAPHCDAILEAYASALTRCSPRNGDAAARNGVSRPHAYGACTRDAARTAAGAVIWVNRKGR